MKNSILLIFIFYLGLISCTYDNNKKNPKNIITRLTFERMDSLEPADTKDNSDDRYIVSGFVKTKKNYLLIDSFVCENIDTNKVKKYRDYYIYFYRYSEKTNNEYLKKVPRDFYRYSMDHDIICSYHWSEGEFFPKEIYPTFYEYESIDIDTLDCGDTIFVFPY